MRRKGIAGTDWAYVESTISCAPAHYATPKRDRNKDHAPRSMRAMLVVIGVANSKLGRFRADFCRIGFFRYKRI
jgi:hypothetical protein